MTAASVCSSARLPEIVGADLRVPLADGRECRYANFDYAASAPALAAVAERVRRLLPTSASVHRGAGHASRISTAAYEDARIAVARFIGAPADHVVVFTRNTTDSLNLLAGCVPGDTLVLDIEHHANFLPWQRRGRRVVAAADTVEETVRRVRAALRAAPAALVSVTGASNVTGETLPIRRLADIAHAHGARIAVDAAQLAPHRRIDMAADGIDYLAFSGHKLYAPFGAGVLVGRRDWLDAAPAYLAGGGAAGEVTTTGCTWLPAPRRHEGGSPNLLGAAAIAAACETLSGVDPAVMGGHERALTERLRTGLAALPGVTPARVWSDSVDDVGIVAFTVDGVESGEVARYLADEHGIGVRDGRFCAYPLLRRLGLPSAVRAGIGLGTRAEDVTRLVDAVAALVEARPQPGRSDARHGIRLSGQKLALI